ncbi:Clp protease ClpP, partial [Streptococcus agalactiae]
VVKLQASLQPPKPQKTIPFNQLEKRLNLLK